MPLCPTCKTFYVEDPCPNCENNDYESVKSKNQGVGGNQDENVPESVKTTEEELVDFFGNVSNADEVDLVTGRRKTRDTLVSTPWHREREIRSINQRRVGEEPIIPKTKDDQVTTKKSSSELTVRGTTSVSSSKSPATARRPLIDKSLFNPVSPTKSSREIKKSTASSIEDEVNFLAHSPSRTPNQRMMQQKSLELSRVVDSQPTSLPSPPRENEGLTMKESESKMKSPSPPITPSKPDDSSRSLSLPASTTRDSDLKGSEPEIPKWLLADKSTQPPSRIGTSKPLTSSSSQVNRFSEYSIDQPGIQSSETSRRIVKRSGKRGILGFLRRKLSRGGKADVSSSAVQVEKVDLSATHVKAGGLTLPRWLVGEKVEEESTKSTSEALQASEDVKTTPVTMGGPSSSSQDEKSPRVIDNTLLELERKFKDNMPQMPTIPARENVAASLREDLEQDSSTTFHQLDSGAPNDDVELSSDSSLDDFDEFDLEELAAQVIAQLDAPNIRETEHRLDPQSLDMLESLAAEFLKETAGKEGIVRTEVVRHDSVTSLALNPQYSQELKEIPGFDDEEEKQELKVTPSSRTSTSAKASSAIPLRKSQTMDIRSESPIERTNTSRSMSSTREVSSVPTTKMTYRRSTLKRPAVAVESPVDLTKRPVVIAVEDLVKTYKLESGKEHRVLLGIQMEIYQGEWVAIVGPSGSGKSTLLNILGGLDNPTVGSVYILGKDITKMSDRELSQYRLKTVGFVFQFFNLVPELTAVENIEFPQRLLGVDRRKARERAEELLDWIDLWEVKDQRVDLLSGGEQQRVAICVALANDPPIILMDEPTGNLDKANTDLVMDIFESLNRDFGKTLVCVTHDLDVAARAHRVYSLVNGKLIEGKAIVD